MATSPMPSWGPHCGERSMWLHHPCLLGVPIVGRDQCGYITPTFSGSPLWGEINVATSPMPSRAPHSGERPIGLHHPCLLRVPIVGKDQYGYITPAFSGFPMPAAQAPRVLREQPTHMIVFLPQFDINVVFPGCHDYVLQSDPIAHGHGIAPGPREGRGDVATLIFPHNGDPEKAGVM